MPCNSDYMAPSTKERELQRTAKLLVYLQRQLGQEPEAWLLHEANNIYSSNDQSVIKLCDALRQMSPTQMDSIVYNGHNKTARDLADWWEEHQAADVERERTEAIVTARKQLRDQALSKLTSEEKEALGITA